VELLRDTPVYSSGVQAELVTPTGAAIVKDAGFAFAAFPEMKLRSPDTVAGHGIFRGIQMPVGFTIGEVGIAIRWLAKTASETITVLEANLDDLNRRCSAM